MPSAVPAPLASIAERLACPVCRQPLAPAQGSLQCRRGHTYDVAREGYVTLLEPIRRPVAGDDAEMVAARAAVQGAGHFEPLTAALADTAHAIRARDASVVLDVGAGTGYHLAGLLGAFAHAHGIALDASRHASRRAGRAHRRIAAVRGDVWRRIPLGDAKVDLAMVVFAPRNGTELARVVRPGGAVIVVTPASEHLHELSALHTVRIDARKTERLHRQLTPWLRPSDARRLTWGLRLTRSEARCVLCMGPSGRHLPPELERRLAAFAEPLLVTAAVELRTFTRPGSGTVPVRGRQDP